VDSSGAGGIFRGFSPATTRAAEPPGARAAFVKEIFTKETNASTAPSGTRASQARRRSSPRPPRPPASQYDARQRNIIIIFTITRLVGITFLNLLLLLLLLRWRRPLPRRRLLRLLRLLLLQVLLLREVDLEPVAVLLRDERRASWHWHAGPS
jgi:hypothetical protein